MVEKIKNFTDLVAWQEAHKLVLEIYRITKRFPIDERFGLSIQLRRAVISVTGNIAEGFSRNSYKEKIQFYTFALASLSEVQNYLILSKDLRYIPENSFSNLDQHIVRVNKIIHGLIKSSRHLLHT